MMQKLGLRARAWVNNDGSTNKGISMQISINRLFDVSVFGGFVASAVRKFVPNLNYENGEAQFERDLERLAETAPHVLDDMGFHREMDGPRTTVWRRGALTVISQRDGAGVTILRR